MPHEKIWGPRIFQNQYGYDISFKLSDLETMQNYINQPKGYGTLKIRQGKKSGKWYTEIVDTDAENTRSEIRVQDERAEQPDLSMPVDSGFVQPVRDDDLPF